MPKNSEETYLTPAELVTRWQGRVSVRTLANWRSGEKKRGPSFTKLGSSVAYPLSAVLSYEKQRTQEIKK